MTKAPANTVLSGEAAVRLGISRPHVALLCRAGELKGYQIGRDWFIKESSIAARIKKMAGVARKGHPIAPKKGAK